VTPLGGDFGPSCSKRRLRRRTSTPTPYPAIDTIRRLAPEYLACTTATYSLWNAAQVELYIYRSGGAEENERIFDLLLAQQEAIEFDFGEPLEWQRNEGANPCRIFKPLDIRGWEDEDRWSEMHDAMINAMIRLDKALGPRVRELKA
jgi:hypothetical protein